MKRTAFAVVVLMALTALTAIAFIPLPQKLKMVKRKALPVARALHQTVHQGDTLIAYLADAAGNIATAWAIVDSTTQDSFYIHIVPQYTKGQHGRP